jgi:hypothetical protein
MTTLLEEDVTFGPRVRIHHERAWFEGKLVFHADFPTETSVLVERTNAMVPSRPSPSHHPIITFEHSELDNCYIELLS